MRGDDRTDEVSIDLAEVCALRSHVLNDLRFAVRKKGWGIRLVRYERLKVFNPLALLLCRTVNVEPRCEVVRILERVKHRLLDRPLTLGRILAQELRHLLLGHEWRGFVEVLRKIWVVLAYAREVFGALILEEDRNLLRLHISILRLDGEIGGVRLLRIT